MANYQTLRRHLRAQGMGIEPQLKRYTCMRKRGLLKIGAEAPNSEWRPRAQTPPECVAEPNPAYVEDPGGEAPSAVVVPALYCTQPVVLWLSPFSDCGVVPRDAVPPVRSSDSSIWPGGA